MEAVTQAGAAAGWAAHVAAILLAVLLAAYGGGRLARLVGQPAVIGEMGIALFAGPALAAAGGPARMEVLLPAARLEAVQVVGHVGLALFLVGVAYGLRTRPIAVPGRPLWRVVGGSLGVSAAVGCLFAGWAGWTGEAGLRGTAPGPAFVLLLAVAFSVTALPVLSRILVDQGIAHTAVARLAIASAMVIDVVAWIALSAAIGLAGGEGLGRMPGLAALIVGGGMVTILVRRSLAGDRAGRFCHRFPRLTALLIAACVLGLSGAMREWGLTEIFGAMLVGFAIPAPGEESAWSRSVHRIAQVGRRLMPVFFVTVGLTVFTAPAGGVHWTAIFMATGAGVLAKVGGGYAGARMGGLSHLEGLRFGVLMNTRGLTELVILQAGHAAGLLTAPLFLALAVMTLVTTAMTGPLYALLTPPAPAARRSPAGPGPPPPAARRHGGAENLPTPRSPEDE